MFLYGTKTLLWKPIFTAVFEKHILNTGGTVTGSPSAPRETRCPGVLSQKQHRPVTDSSESLLAEYSSLECTCQPKKGPATSGKTLLSLKHSGSREEDNVRTICFSFHSMRPSGSYSAPIFSAPHCEEDKANALLVCLSCTYSDFYVEVVPGTACFKLSDIQTVIGFDWAVWQINNTVD